MFVVCCGLSFVVVLLVAVLFLLSCVFDCCGLRFDVCCAVVWCLIYVMCDCSVPFFCVACCVLFFCCLLFVF